MSVAIVGIGAIGVVLLTGGGLMLLAGRRRRTWAEPRQPDEESRPEAE